MTPLRLVGRALSRCWATLLRMRTALWLLLAVATVALLAAFLPQEPTAPATVAHWRAGVTGPGETVTALLDAMGMLDVFGSMWFLALTGLLVASLTGCLLQRWRAHLRSRRRPPPARSGAPVRRRRSFVTGASPDAALDIARAVLRRRRFAVRLVEPDEAPDGRRHVAAERGRLRETGSLVFHTAILALLAGAGITHLWGFSGQVDLVVGDTVTDAAVSYDRVRAGRFWDPGDHRGFSVTVDAFRTGMHPGGIPTEFVADATITPRFDEPRTVRLEVNHPASQQGMLVHLARHGLAPRIVVTEPDGSVRLEAAAHAVSTGPLASRAVLGDGTPGTPGAGLLHLVLLPNATVGPDGRATAIGEEDGATPVLLVDVHPGAVLDPLDTLRIDPATPAAGPTTAVALGDSAALPDGATVTFVSLERWVGLQVTHTPGWQLLLAGALALLLGLIASLYAYPCRIWVDARPDDAGVTQIVVSGVTRARPEAFDAELARVLSRLGDRLPVPQPAARERART